MMEHKNNIFRLNGKIQHYQWGGFNYIPQLLGIENSNHQPFAEYWLGAHVNAPAVMENDETLYHFLEQYPEALGKEVQQQFGRLPYLLKILDVKDMLSIQVHPSKQSAEIEFAKENESGIELNAPQRNYKDDNHKPELMQTLVCGGRVPNLPRGNQRLIIGRRAGRGGKFPTCRFSRGKLETCRHARGLSMGPAEVIRRRDLPHWDMPRGAVLHHHVS